MPELVGHARVPRWSCSTTTTCPTPRSGSTSESLAVVRDHLGDFTESLPRALCWASAWDMTRDGELATRDYLELVLSGIGKESDIGVVQSLHRQVKLALDLYADPDWRETGPDPLDRGDAGAPARRRARQRPPARLGPRVRRDGPHRRAARPARRACWTARESIEGLAVDTELRWALRAAAGRHRPRRRGGDRRRAGARPHLGGRAARGAAPGRPGRPRRRRRRRGRRSSRPTSCPTPCRRRSSAASSRPTSGSCWRPTPSGTSRRSRTSGRPAATRWPSRSRSASTRPPRSPRPRWTTDAWLASARPAPALRRLVVESRSGVERALRAQAADAAAAGGGA